MIGEKIYNLAKELFYINRSLTGDGARKTLEQIKKLIPIKIKEIPTGEKCFDWEVPKEWNCKEAYIVTPDGKKICEYSKNNLHILQYSTPQNRQIDLKELDKHLYSLPDLPDAIPYVTSYYKENWGFCISQNDKNKLKEGVYKVFIDSELKNGSLTYADLIIPGKSKEEILFSTYICHPSLANDNLSGIVLTTFLAKYILEKNRRFTYRFVFIPETIGSICYISKHLSKLKENVKAGFVVTCVGDDRDYSFVASRFEDTLADKVAIHVLKHTKKDFKRYSFLDRGSDERQYCSIGVDLPVCSVMRSKYVEYKEYHTSLDDLSLISPSGFEGSFKVYKQIIDILENNYRYKTTTICEPQLGKRGLYPAVSTPEQIKKVKYLRNIIAYADGNKDLIDIAEILKTNAYELIEIVKNLEEKKVLCKNLD